MSDIVTEQPGESLDPKPSNNDVSKPIPDGSKAIEDSASAVTQPDGTPFGEEGLPEWEPLTPELVEDEAIRGDFVIRWVVVGLALLLGVSQISETRTLIHLKNGQYLANHGFLPGSKDVFSYTASDRTWVNLSWLFDISLAAVYSLAGGIGLSILQGLLAGLAFSFLSLTVRPNIRTWWGSICAALALLACYQQFTVQPEIVSLVGISFFLWTLVQSEEPGQSGKVWRLIPAMFLWAQLDQRAWFGWFLLVLWAVGEWLSREPSSDGGTKLFWTVALASIFVAGIHPFLWESWLAPARMYLTDYPAMRFAYQRPISVDQAFYPIWSKFNWTTIHHRLIAALFLAAATLVTMFLNRSKVKLSHLFAFIGFNGLSMFATHELAVASFVNCAICTLNAQGWYREKFGQVYSVDWRELLFSRGGRAVTVMGFFTLAWLILSGRLDGPGGKRTGVGFDSHLANAMTDYQNLNSDLVDDHPFNFSVRQGDLMIWGGQKTFVDSRVGLYYGSGGSNLLSVHNKTRMALQAKREQIEGTGDPTVWKPVFDKYQIRQAWPRLNGPVPPPDYTTLFDLLASSEFRLSSLVSSTAVFLRMDQPDETTMTYQKDHLFDVIKLAYRTNSNTEELTREWSKAATSYDNLFSLRRPVLPSGIQAGMHYMQLAASNSRLPIPQRLGYALLAIRHANDGLRNEPNCVEGYRILGLIYSIVGQLESSILAQGGPVVPNTVRYFESITAFHQAIALQPDDLGAIRQLFLQYEMMGRQDIQLELLRKLKRLQPYSKSMTDEQRQERERLIEAIGRLEEQVTRVDSMVAKHLDDGADRFQIAAGAYQAGGLLRAIKTLEEDAIYLEKNPQAKLVLGNWLMEAGRGREAAEIFDTLEGMAGDSPFTSWRDPAAISSLLTANYVRAIKLWSDQTRSSIDGNLPPALFTLPFLTLSPTWMDPTSIAAPIAQLMQGVRIEGAGVHFQIAQAQIENGAVDDAANSIRLALQLDPNSQIRPLLAFYLECLTGEKNDPQPQITAQDEYADLSDPDALTGPIVESKPKAALENTQESKLKTEAKP